MKGVHPNMFSNQSQEGGINFFQKVFGTKEFLDSMDNVSVDNVLVQLKEDSREAVRVRGLLC